MYITFGKSTADKSSNYIISALTDIFHCATHSQADMTCWYQTCYDSFICAMTHSYMPRHHSFTCGHDLLISTYIHTHMCHASFICVMTQSHVPWRHSFTCGHDSLISTYILSHLRHDSFIHHTTTPQPCSKRGCLLETARSHEDGVRHSPRRRRPRHQGRRQRAGVGVGLGGVEWTRGNVSWEGGLPVHESVIFVHHLFSVEFLKSHF